jgi:hypothetical protein
VINATVTERAAFDLDCAQEKLKTTEVGHATYGVIGCGRRAAYVIIGACDRRGNCQAVMNSSDGQPVTERR